MSFPIIKKNTPQIGGVVTFRTADIPNLSSQEFLVTKSFTDSTIRKIAEPYKTAYMEAGQCSFFIIESVVMIEVISQLRARRYIKLYTSPEEYFVAYNSEEVLCSGKVHKGSVRSRIRNNLEQLDIKVAPMKPQARIMLIREAVDWLVSSPAHLSCINDNIVASRRIRERLGWPRVMTPLILMVYKAYRDMAIIKSKQWHSASETYVV